MAARCLCTIRGRRRTEATTTSRANRSAIIGLQLMMKIVMNKPILTGINAKPLTTVTEKLPITTGIIARPLINIMVHSPITTGIIAGPLHNVMLPLPIATGISVGRSIGIVLTLSMLTGNATRRRWGHERAMMIQEVLLLMCLAMVIGPFKPM